MHTKRGAAEDAPKTLRVDYRAGPATTGRANSSASSTGYARQKAVAWWRQRSPDPVPDTAEQAVEIAEGGGVAHAERITVRSVAGEKYDRIVAHKLGPLPEPIPTGALRRLQARRDSLLMTQEDTTTAAAAGRPAISRGGPVRAAGRSRREAPALGGWKDYQSRLPEAQEVASWFSNGCDAVCLVAGGVSGNLEMIDFDRGGELFEAWRRKIPPDLLATLVIETSQSRGRHVIYRCQQAVSGSLKLAQRRAGDDVVTLIETRGDGGLFLCARRPATTWSRATWRRRRRSRPSSARRCWWRPGS